MKHNKIAGVAILMMIAGLMINTSCGSGNDQAEQQEMIAQGAVLVDESDCNTCHHKTNRLIGPSHTEVAKKYETTDKNIELIANRIIKGGSGVWGDIPMTPHADLSVDDAKKMARYVLSLDETN